MYESFFQFHGRPFAAAPLPERYFPAEATDQARRSLVRAIERAEGPGVVVGAAGSGKTLLCHVLAERFRSDFHVVMLASARFRTRSALLKNILLELNLPCRDMEEDDLRLSLMAYLEPRPNSASGMLLLVDEAHTLPLRLLEEIRSITNFLRNGQPCVRLVLAGCPLLEDRLASPMLESLSQRLAARCYLQPFSREETLAYVHSQISAVGGNPGELFASDALEAVYRACDGIPRLINQVCDRALMMAASGGRRRLDSASVEEAWSDLQQLPTPGQGAVRQAAPKDDAVVEFGVLEDAGDDAKPTQEDERAASEAGQAGQEEHTIKEPSDQLDDIELRVAEIQAEESPASDSESVCGGAFEPSAGPPEVELVFRSTRNPFDELFQEEEIVIDRYASLEAGSPHRWPLVSSAESRELAAALLSVEVEKTAAEQGNSEEAIADSLPIAPPCNQTSDARRADAPEDPLPTGLGGEFPTPPPSGSSDDDSSRGLDALQPDDPLQGRLRLEVRSPTPLGPHDENGGTEDEEPFDPASDPVMPEHTAKAFAGPRVFAVGGPEAASETNEPETPLRQSILRTLEGDDRDIIIVGGEDSQCDTAAVGAAEDESTGRRRQEYRQLFAKLRRG